MQIGDKQKAPIFDAAGTVHIELEKKPPGNLILSSTPEDAEVYIDGSRKGKTPLKILLDEGNYTVNFHKNPFDDFTKEVKVISEKRSKIHGVLGGNIKIESKPPEAQIYLNNKRIGLTPFVTRQLIKGLYNLIIRKDGYIPADISVPEDNFLVLRTDRLFQKLFLQAILQKGNSQVRGWRILGSCGITQYGRKARNRNGEI